MSLVLIADDEESVLDVACDVLDGLGHEVMRATDGEQALTLARSRVPDLIVSDVMMPRRSGIDLLRAVREDPTLLDVPVILMSAARAPSTVAPTAFLPKPLGLEAFESAVSKALSVRTERHSVAEAIAAAHPPAARGDGRDEMLNWVAHELKTPLASVKLNTQLALRRLGDADAAVLRSLDAVVRGLGRMEGLINSILDAASLAEGRVALRRSRCDLREFVAERVAEWTLQAPDATLRSRMPDEPVMVAVDVERLRHVFDNLLSNAVKYGGHAGPIEIDAERAPGRAIVRVRDHGPGIPASELPRLFDRFHRAPDAKGGGHGLGLFIAAAVARLHGGVLGAHSAVGEGTTFTLTLPLAK